MSHSMTREAAGQAKEFAGQVSEKAVAMMHVAQETAADLSHRAQEGAGAMQEAAAGYLGRGREKAEAFGRTVEAQVKEWPFWSLLVASGVGLLLGVVLARR